VERARRTWPLALVLVLLVALLGQGRLLSPLQREASPWVLAELLLPGLLAEDVAPITPLFEARPPPAGQSLSAAALGAPARGPEAPWSYVGQAPLLLALLALVTAGGWLAWLLRACLAWGLLCAWLPGWPAAPLLASLAGLSGLGAVRLARADPDGRSVSAHLALGATAVLLAAALIGLALWAGAVTDREALQPLLSRLAPSERPNWTPELLAGNAGHLRAVLDRSALAAFVSMSVLLVHLKERRALTGWLIVLAVSGDLLSLTGALL
jgi:hypothetical protein